MTPDELADKITPPQTLPLSLSTVNYIGIKDCQGNQIATIQNIRWKHYIVRVANAYPLIGELVTALEAGASRNVILDYDYLNELIARAKAATK